MKRAFALGATFLFLSAAGAAAQVYPGEEVTVNPGAVGHGYLLYPGGKYGRHVGNLLQPGERADGVIHLHMPVRHKRVAVVRKPRPAPTEIASAPATVPDAAPAPAPNDLSYNDPSAGPTTPAPAPVKRAPPPRRVASAPRPAPTPAPVQSAPPPDMAAMPDDSASRLIGDTGPAPAPLPPKPRRAAPQPARAADAGSPFEGATAVTAPAPKPRRTASATPPGNVAPTGAVAAGLHKQSTIAFAEGASSPAVSDVTAVHSLAATLNAALGAGGANRVQLDAYGGPRGDKSSDSHRLSLKRALVIRELLIEDGVPADKIDVRALGGTDDGGAADRVDVFTHA
jgi:outer membrane protein OmpA-like peptidoglycan-associated protein